MAQSQQTETQVFNGGIHTRIASHLVQQNESVAMSNVDVRNGTLLSAQNHVREEDATLSMFYWHNGKYHYYDAFRSNVVWNGTYYWSDAFAVSKYIEGVGDIALGIDPPIDRPTLAVQTPSAEGLTGKYTYLYTYYDRANDIESPPSPPAVSILADNEAIRIEGLVNSPQAATYELRLYRVGEGVTVFTSVKTFPAGTAAYTDELHFTEIEAYLLETTRAFPPESIMVNLAQSRGRFYGTVGSFLRWSAIGKPDSWYILDSMSFPDEIRAIAAVANGLIVCTKRETYLVTGDVPIRFQRHLISASEGCVSNQSMAVHGGTAIWLSEDGIVSSNGSGVQGITMPKLDKIIGIDPLSATIYNNTYYLGYTEQMFPSDTLYPAEDLFPARIENKQAFPTGIYLVDFTFPSPVVLFSYQNKIGYLDRAGEYIDQIQLAEQLGEGLELEGSVDILLLENLSEFNLEAPAANTRFHMFEGDHEQELIYNSPLHTEGSIGVEKQYEKARIVFQGEFEIILRNEGGFELASTAVSSDFIVSEWIGISPKNNRGYGIQYFIKGRGHILSLSHVWTPREAQ